MTRRWPRLPAPPLSPGRTRQGHRGRRPGPPARFPSPALAPIRALPPAGAARTPDVGGRRSEVGGRRPAAARSEQGQQGGRRGNAPGRPQLAAPPPGARILTSAAPRTGCGRDALKRQEAPSRVKAGPLSAEEPAGAGRPAAELPARSGLERLPPPGKRGGRGDEHGTGCSVAGQLPENVSRRLIEKYFKTLL